MASHYYVNLYDSSDYMCFLIIARIQAGYSKLYLFIRDIVGN